MTYRPQVLLLGNGLNRAYGGCDWAGLLSGLHDNPRVCLDAVKKLPFPLQVIIATNDRVDKAINAKSELFKGLKDVELIREPIEELLSIPFDHILTTNYSYEIERVADGRVDISGKYCSKLMSHTKSVNRAEQKHLLHTYNEVDWKGKKHKIWHIHGEARKPDSIIIGHYYYGKLLSKYQEVFNSRGNKQAIREAKKEEPILNSWLDAFIMGDVYVLGFGFDYSEFDLWWLLNRKMREKASHGKLVFYTEMEGNEVKAQLLQTYGAEVECLEFFSTPSDYKKFYSEAIQDIKYQINKKIEEKQNG